MKAGSYVVCVNDSNWDAMAYVLLPKLPVKGHIYIVRRVIPNIDDNCSEDGIALEGIYGEWRIFNTYFGTKVYEEYHFRMSRFREIDAPDIFLAKLFQEIEEVQLQEV